MLVIIAKYIQNHVCDTLKTNIRCCSCGVSMEQKLKEFIENCLKIKNHDLFLKVVQEPITQPKEEQIKEPVQSLSDLTNKLIWG